MLFWNPLAFSMIQWVLAVWSSIQLVHFYIWTFSIHILLKPSLKAFEHYLASMWNEYNCLVVETFFGIALLWDWNESWPFPGLWPILSFPNLLAYWVQHFKQHHLLGFEISQLEFHHLLALFIVNASWDPLYFKERRKLLNLVIKFDIEI